MTTEPNHEASVDLGLRTWPRLSAAVGALLAVALLVGCGTDTGGSTTAFDIGLSDATVADTSAADDIAADTDTAADGATVDDSTTQGDTDAAADVAAGPTFHVVWTDVLVAQGCSGTYCHGGVWPNEDAAYAEIMKAKTGVLKCSAKTLVVPGQPEQSLLWLKSDANAAHGCGVKMPVGSSKGLPAELSKLLKDWIAAGAKR